MVLRKAGLQPVAQPPVNIWYAMMRILVPHLQRLVCDSILRDLQVLEVRRTSAHHLLRILLYNARVAAEGPVRHI